MVANGQQGQGDFKTSDKGVTMEEEYPIFDGDFHEKETQHEGLVHGKSKEIPKTKQCILKKSIYQARR